MGILEKLTETDIKVPLVSTTKEDVLKELIAVLKANNAITNEEAVYTAVMNREKQGSTGLGEELAIPHAKTTVVESISIVIGIAPSGIEFQSLDGKPVKIFFLILANPNYASVHIEALSEVAKLMRDKPLCQQLLAAQTAQEIINLLKVNS